MSGLGKPTPGPWGTEAWDIRWAVTHPDGFICVTCQGNDEANAKRIATACNAHDKLLAACKALEKAEANYRLAHDLYGDGSIASGIAWDKLRKCGDKARAVIALAEAAP